MPPTLTSVRKSPPSLGLRDLAFRCCCFFSFVCLFVCFRCFGIYVKFISCETSCCCIGFLQSMAKRYNLPNYRFSPSWIHPIHISHLPSFIVSSPSFDLENPFLRDSRSKNISKHQSTMIIIAFFISLKKGKAFTKLIANVM